MMRLCSYHGGTASVDIGQVHSGVACLQHDAPAFYRCNFKSRRNAFSHCTGGTAPSQRLDWLQARAGAGPGASGASAQAAHQAARWPSCTPGSAAPAHPCCPCSAQTARRASPLGNSRTSYFLQSAPHPMFEELIKVYCSHMSEGQDPCPKVKTASYQSGGDCIGNSSAPDLAA